MRKNFVLLMVVVGLLLFPSGGDAQNSRQAVEFTVYGVGLESCGTWLELRKTDSVDAKVLLTWLSGWVSAAGYYGASIQETDSSAMAAWVDNHCRANPLDRFVEAAQALVRALRRKP